MTPEIITPAWPAPAQVRAYSTTRRGGVSEGAYESLNLGLKVGDAAAAVERNRLILHEALNLPESPRWLEQVHGARVVDAQHWSGGCAADGSYASRANLVCAVQTADCLPVCLCTEQGDWVAVVHAGWRSLAGGVIEAALDRAPVGGEGVLAWLGPAISQSAFEVGDEVRTAFLTWGAQAAEAFTVSPNGRWLADLYLLARQRLRRRGIGRIYGGDFCTFGDDARFYSYRRDKVTGRMATLIWLEA